MRQGRLMENECIAIIYEGDKTEKLLFNNIKKNFFDDSLEIKIVSFPAGENIYMLYKQLKKDDFETDLIELIKEYNPLAAKELKDIERNRFSQIFLFFDYDGHNNNLSKEKDLEGELVIEEMLSAFDNETELGKLYLNYPMVESLRDNEKVDYCFRRCSIPIAEIGRYKNSVSNSTYFQDFRKLTKEHWKILSVRAVCKANCIIFGTYILPDFTEYRKNVNQLIIYKKQHEKYIDSKNEIAVLNAFPLFLLDYFKDDFWVKMLLNEI